MTTPPNGKFFFDHNIFDENGMELRELEANKPPPTYGIEIVEAAREEGFKRGRAAGLAESQASRDQHIAKVLEKIAGSMSSLFDGENAREKIFEMESVQLTLAVFKRLFPVLNARHGFDELKDAMTQILNRTSGQGEITIDVFPEYAPDVEKHVQAIMARNGNIAKISVRGNDSLDRGDCRFTWADGGAVRNSGEMADKIVATLEESLAARGGNVHDT